MLQPEIVVPEVQVVLELVWYLMELAQCLNLRKAEKNKSTLCMAKKGMKLEWEKKKTWRRIWRNLFFVIGKLLRLASAFSEVRERIQIQKLHWHIRIDGRSQVIQGEKDRFTCLVHVSDLKTWEVKAF